MGLEERDRDAAGQVGRGKFALWYVVTAILISRVAALPFTCAVLFYTACLCCLCLPPSLPLQSPRLLPRPAPEGDAVLRLHQAGGRGAEHVRGWRGGRERERDVLTVGCHAAASCSPCWLVQLAGQDRRSELGEWAWGHERGTCRMSCSVGSVN